MPKYGASLLESYAVEMAQTFNDIFYVPLTKAIVGGTLKRNIMEPIEDEELLKKLTVSQNDKCAVSGKCDRNRNKKIKEPYIPSAGLLEIGYEPDSAKRVSFYKALEREIENYNKILFGGTISNAVIASEFSGRALPEVATISIGEMNNESRFFTKYVIGPGTKHADLWERESRENARVNKLTINGEEFVQRPKWVQQLDIEKILMKKPQFIVPSDAESGYEDLSANELKGEGFKKIEEFARPLAVPYGNVKRINTDYGSIIRAASHSSNKEVLICGGNHGEATLAIDTLLTFTEDIPPIFESGVLKEKGIRIDGNKDALACLGWIIKDNKLKHYQALTATSVRPTFEKDYGTVYSNQVLAVINLEGTV